MSLPTTAQNGHPPIQTKTAVVSNRALDVLANKLIDQSKRNRLLNAPIIDPSRRGGLSIVPIDSPDFLQVFEWLSDRDKAYPVAVMNNGQTSLFPTELDENGNGHGSKTTLRSSYPPKLLSSALSNLRNRGRASLDERGVNILFAAFGVVEWVDPASESDVWRAPVVLLPIAVDRKNGGFTVAGINEETLANPALAYKFQTDYGIALDELPDDPSTEALNEYMAKMETLAIREGHPFHGQFRVDRSVSIGVFSFAKIAMFRELVQLGAGNLLQHEVIASLVNSDSAPTYDFSDDTPPDLDAHFTPQKTWLVVDADSSQMEAVYRSQTGKHLAIQGPPGTGKSQTIVNLIADALARKKTVLFVAEKRVALDVVKKRLDQAGIGDACLVIHPGKAEGAENGGSVNKKAVLAEVQRAWSAPVQPPMPGGKDTVEELADVRKKLNSYVDELHRPRFAIEASFFDIFGQCEQLRSMPDVDFRVTDATSLTRAELNRRLAFLDDFEEMEEFMRDTRLETPWFELILRHPTPAFIQTLRERIEELNDLELELISTLDMLGARTGLCWPKDFISLKYCCDFLSRYRLDALALPDIEELFQAFTGKYAGVFKFFHKSAYQTDCERLRPLWRNGWTGEPRSIAACLQWFGKLRQALKVPQGFSVAPDDHDLSALAARLVGVMKRLKELDKYLSETFHPNVVRRLQVAEKGNAETIAWTRSLLDRFDEAGLSLLFRIKDESPEGEPLRQFVRSALQVSTIPVLQWRHAYEKCAWNSLREAAYGESQDLTSFSSTAHERLLARFRDLDRRQIEVARRSLARLLATRRATLTEEAQRAASSEVAVLTREFKKKRIKPLRKLLTEVPTVIRSIKPCFMMSPLSVSQYLDPSVYTFDVVIFDEASQVRMEDAIGSIYRGCQIIVVGDEQQLPPTRFFDVVETGDDPDDEVEDATGYESILTRAEGDVRAFRQVDLRWHYRSKNEELIAFSNKEFYNNRLFTFPNPAQAGQDKAIRFVHVPDGVYDRGHSRTNPIEARAVAQACLTFADEHPTWSLGVVTFSETQRQMIDDEVELLLLERPELRNFFSEGRIGGEPFMVKNLELIQGDERDAIYFSFGYGRDKTGAFTQNFGPLNQDAGRRRLNVAVTRARRMVTVFSSVQPEDLTAASQNVGVRLMKEYMALARDGMAALFGDPATAQSTGETESPFEDAVLKALRAKGLDVRPQIGCSGYRIDLGVIDPLNPGRFCLGVECDGAAYHSSRTARDRDRLRQQVLEGLGWNIIRIWSKSWNENPNREVRRILDAVRSCAGKDTQPVESDFTKPEPMPVTPEPEDLPLPPVRSAEEVFPDQFGKYILYQRPIHQFGFVSQQDIEIGEIVKLQGPTSVNAIVRQIAHLWGYTRTGDQIRANVLFYLFQAERAKRVLITPDRQFVYPLPPAPLKILVSCNGEQREVDGIPDEEVYLALWLAVKISGGSISISDACRVAVNLWGFQRVTDEWDIRFRSVIARSKQIEKSPYYKADCPLIEEDDRLKLG